MKRFPTKEKKKPTTKKHVTDIKLEREKCGIGYRVTAGHSPLRCQMRSIIDCRAHCIRCLSELRHKIEFIDLVVHRNILKIKNLFIVHIETIVIIIVDDQHDVLHKLPNTTTTKKQKENE